ncbi:MAG: hypothetical protein ACRD8U_09660 [Pyrinomonadaceae bacterium]
MASNTRLKASLEVKQLVFVLQFVGVASFNKGAAGVGQPFRNIAN